MTPFMVDQPLTYAGVFRSRLFAAILFAVITGYAYQPAFHRVFFGDQISYFAELQGQTSLSAGLEHYDYAVSRRYWKGDDALFRPLSLAWLAVGNTLFSYHHVWWNIATLGLHVLVTFFLFQLLLQIRASPFALPVAALFAVMMPSLELVVWNHLGGYLLAYLFFAIALSAFTGIVQSEKPPSSIHVAIYVSAFTLAVFFHETMVPVCLIASGVLCVLWRRRNALTLGRGLIVFVPLLLFILLYTFHIWRAERITFVDRAENARIFEPGNMLAIPGRSLFVIGRWMGDILVPSAVRYQAMPFARLYSTLKFSWVTTSHLWNAALAAAALWFVWSAFSPTQAYRNLPLLVVLVGALLAHIGVISLGRGQSEVLTTMYYRYFFSMLVCALVYAVADFDRLRRWRAAMAWVPLIALIVLHLTETRATAQQIGRANQKASDYLSRMAEFVDEHKAEPGFSFAVQNVPLDVDPEIVLVEGYPDRTSGQRRVRSSEILFARYYRAQDPQYTLAWDGRALNIEH
jgi:hypothetical protein